jgi:hypothetical protein
MHWDIDTFFQILMMLLGVYLGSLVSNLPKRWQKMLTAGVGISLVLGGTYWMGYSQGDSTRRNGSINLPVESWLVKGTVAGGSASPESASAGAFELKSRQDADGYTSDYQRLDYTWPSPGALPALHGVPMRGIAATLTILPLQSEDEARLVGCHYTLAVGSGTYTSVNQFVPFRQPVTLVWDFVGRLNPTDFKLANNNQEALAEASAALDRETNSLGFTYFFRRLSELWQYQKLVLHNYDQNELKNLLLSCNVSATREYVGGEEGSEFAFRGKFLIDRILVWPYEK